SPMILTRFVQTTDAVTAAWPAFDSPFDRHDDEPITGFDIEIAALRNSIVDESNAPATQLSASRQQALDESLTATIGENWRTAEIAPGQLMRADNERRLRSQRVQQHLRGALIAAADEDPAVDRLIPRSVQLARRTQQARSARASHGTANPG